jgi:hypothetical protein
MKTDIPWAEKGHWNVCWSQDWSEWFTGGMNWRTFTFLNVDYEDEIYMGSRELNFGFLGFNVRLAWVYNDHAEMRQEVQRRFTELMEQTGAQAVAIHPDALAELIANQREPK